MKIHCQLCKEIVALGPYRIAGEAIEITCAACGGRFRVTTSGEVTELGAGAADDEAGSAADAGPAMVCPKCDRRQPEADACRHCGLRADLFEQFADGGDEAPEALVALWEQCRASWSSDEAHDRFRDGVAAASAFGYGARCYRTALRDEPGDPIARRNLDRMGRMAEAALLAGAAARRRVDETHTPYRNVVLLLLVILMAAAAAGVYAIAALLDDGGATSSPRPAGIERSTGGGR